MFTWLSFESDLKLAVLFSEVELFDLVRLELLVFFVSFGMVGRTESWFGLLQCLLCASLGPVFPHHDGQRCKAARLCASMVVYVLSSRMQVLLFAG